MLKSALLFYKKLRGDLESAGFKINPYNPCVANKMVNGSQMTNIWHVDDLKILHRDGWEITNIIKWLGKNYGNINMKRGRKHHYLGMDMDFGEKGIVKISMIPYVKAIIKNFPQEVGTSAAAIPAAECLFQVRDQHEVKQLPEEQAVQFHHNVAKFFVGTRARQDIQKAVAFLSTRVKMPDYDDWGKLKR